MQSELVDARRYHHAWDEIEARLARLHAHMSSIKNLQIYMDVDWLARVLDDGIIDNNDNTNNLAPALGWWAGLGYPALGTAPRNYRTAAQHTPLLTNRLRPGMIAKRRR